MIPVKIMPLFIVLIIDLISDIILFQTNQARNHKRVLRSGIILTIAGLAYSTFQTFFIISKINNNN